MIKKIADFLHKLYGVLMMISFFGGFVPVIPFLIALVIGGKTGESIANFLYKDYFPWIIALASIAVLIGLIAMYLNKQQGLSVKSINSSSKN